MNLLLILIYKNEVMKINMRQGQTWQISRLIMYKMLQQDYWSCFENSKVCTYFYYLKREKQVLLILYQIKILIQYLKYYIKAINSMERNYVLFDYRSSHYKQINIMANLQYLRHQVQSNRNSQVIYQIRVDPNTPIYPNDQQEKTNNTDIFTVTLNTNYLCPVGLLKNATQYTIMRNGQPLKLKADEYDVYIGGYHLGDILGILVAEQIRFNTFYFQGIQKRYDTQTSFKCLSKFMDSYTNWQKETGLDKGVQILVRHPRYL